MEARQPFSVELVRSFLEEGGSWGKQRLVFLVGVIIEDI